MTNHGSHADGHDGHIGHGGVGSEQAGEGHVVGVHGMLVVGAEPVFLSHLPMFDHRQHDAQTILEVTFTSGDGAGDPHARYLQDRVSPGSSLYTFAPDRGEASADSDHGKDEFVLADLVTPDPRNPRRRSFPGRLFRDHFEKGGTPIADDVIVTVTNIVYFLQFDRDAEPLADLTYIVFGKGRELFAAHVITRPPDFDQVVSVNIAGHPFTDQDLQHGVRVVVPGRANAIETRLKAGEMVVATVQTAGAQASQATEIRLTADAEIYFEEGELRSPGTFKQTAAEKAAGFA